MSKEKPHVDDDLFLKYLKLEFALWFARNLPKCAYGFSLNEGNRLKVDLRPPNVEDPDFRSMLIELQGKLKLAMSGRGRDPENIAYEIFGISEVQALPLE